MNWLGEIIQNHIRYEDTVLDLGCGIMQATTDSLTKSGRHGRLGKHLSKEIPHVLRCKSLLGCEIVDKYLDKAKQYFPVIKFDLRKLDSFDIFKNKSFDVVMALDVIEHLEMNTALQVIGNMERIARKKIIIYTPVSMKSNDENIPDAWGMGENQFQEHKCFIPANRFREWGYKVQFPDPDRNTLAIKVIR